MKIGIDVGYGYVKIVYGDSRTSKMFNSVVVPAKEFAGVNSDFGDYVYETNGQKYFIGEAAFNRNSKFFQTAFEGDRLNNEVFKKLFLCGLGSCLEMDTTVEVVTGLPVSYFKTHRKEVEKFKGRHIVKLNGKDLLINIDDIKCIPQPLGTYFKLIKYHPEIMKEFILIVDVGFKTTDFLVVDNDRPLPESSSINFGMSDIGRNIVEWVNGRTEKTYRLNQVDELLKKGYIHKGTKLPVEPDIKENAKNELYHSIWNSLIELFPEYTSFERIVFTGGTSEQLDQFILKHQDDVKSIIMASEGQFSNALGYRELLG